MAAEPTAGVPKMAQRNISLRRGIYFCPSFSIPFARSASPYCAEYVYIYPYLTPYRLYMSYRC